MHPIIAALATSPAVGVAVQQAVKELTPVVRSGFRHFRPSFFAPVGGPVLLTSAFAAGVAVGWFTAPRRGAVMRRKVRDGVSSALRELNQRARLKRQNLLAWARAEDASVRPRGARTH